MYYLSNDRYLCDFINDFDEFDQSFNCYNYEEYVKK